MLEPYDIVLMATRIRNPLFRGISPVFSVAITLNNAPLWHRAHRPNPGTFYGAG